MPKIVDDLNGTDFNGAALESPRGIITEFTVNRALGYTAWDAVCEYRDGMHGAPSDWSAESAFESEMNGFTGDIIRSTFFMDGYGVPAMIYRQAFIEAWIKMMS